jgi:hypothetical protein
MTDMTDIIHRQCSFITMETVNYYMYMQRGSNVYAVLRDANKAFDRIGT